MKNLLIIQRGNGNEYMITVTMNVNKTLNEVQDANYEEIKIIFNLETIRWSYILDKISTKYAYQNIHHDWYEFSDGIINEVISDINNLAAEQEMFDKNLLNQTFIVYGKNIGNEALLLCNKEDFTFTRTFMIDLNRSDFTESNKVFLVSTENDDIDLTLEYSSFLELIEHGQIEVK